MRLLTASCALVCSACGGALPRVATDGVDELERLAFIPAAECIFPALSGPSLACVNRAPLLVDRFEVTRGEWRAWRERAPRSSAESASTDSASPSDARALEPAWALDTDQWPAAFLTLTEARAFAASRGMRLPTSQEWIRIACGPGLQPWPWGPSAASGVANTLDLELYRPVGVGTFEQGRSPEGVYDLIGNVWEWVDAPMPWPAAGTPVGLDWVMGGSHLSKLGRLYDRATVAERVQRWSFVQQDLETVEERVQRWSFLHQDLDAETRACDVGFRCVAEAESYLREHAAAWDSSDDAHRRLRAIGSAWGRDAVPLLERLASSDGAARGVSWLLEGARP